MATRTPRIRTRSQPDRLVVVMSDIEMGAGGAADDFVSSPWLATVLRRYLDPRYDHLRLDLVFNGDTFDLLKTSVKETWTHHVTSEIAVAKMERVAEAHPQFFAALRDVLATRTDRVRIHFIAGNHDLELFFPEVQATLRILVGGDSRVRFHGHGFDLGRLHVEHGSQLDPLFRVDPAKPFLEHGGKKILNPGWASVALIDAIIPMQPWLAHHDRLKPKKLVLDLMPEVKELLTSVLWRYWTRDWWRDFFGGDNPVKTVSWTMLKELVWRSVAMDPDVAMDDTLQRRIETSDQYDLHVVGHQHEPGLWNFGDRRVLRTGALRDEFMVSDGGYTQTPINKTWVEAWMHGDDVVRSNSSRRSHRSAPKGRCRSRSSTCCPSCASDS